MKTIRREYMRIIIVIALIILVSSVEFLIRAKSLEAYEGLMEAGKIPDFSSYLNTMAFTYIAGLVDVIVIAICLFFAGERPVSKMLRFIFLGIIALRLINHFFRFDLTSIFYYFLLFLYALLVYLVGKMPVEGGNEGAL